jgi:hypothetical protein
MYLLEYDDSVLDFITSSDTKKRFFMHYFLAHIPREILYN